MNYLNEINKKYPVRRTEEQKNNFIKFTKDELTKYNVSVNAETIDKHTNIIIGDVEKAKVIYTAHYDTPASSVFPNLMFPRNKILSYVYVFTYAFIIVFFSFVFAFLFKKIFNFNNDALIVVYLIIYFLLFYVCTRCVTNKNNINDNTSGVATIFTLVSGMKNNNVAYILFDNEEKGKLGSKAYSKKYKDILKDKLIINFDCVGNGNNIIVVCKDKAINHEYYKLLNESLKPNEEFNVKMYSMKGSSSNTDFLNFECSLSVMACKKSRLVGYYTPNIHTPFDTVASSKNIDFLTESFIYLSNKI